ncbi:zinc ribbon domain-containing protein [Haloarchaeobius litoreus]|uniref:Zinc ribbon domain-containing protein n=1 Tax=Haloarchaeobius litoreus TaxID=755306 RepID=A0ABD6DE50_9EURY|nr:zinc ribbon domain-containing protein [Haloarchaeobius litoreus]
MSTRDDGEVRSGVGPDEVFCTSCGVVIKEHAEICPECGVRQIEPAPERRSPRGSGLPDARTYELRKVARKDKGIVALMGFFLSPVGYLMVGKTGLAIINFLTFNYLLFGVIIVPIHTSSIIGNARSELRRHGETW